jgi:hypothetical protein
MNEHSATDPSNIPLLPVSSVSNGISETAVVNSKAMRLRSSFDRAQADYLMYFTLR